MSCYITTTDLHLSNISENMSFTVYKHLKLLEFKLGYSIKKCVIYFDSLKFCLLNQALSIHQLYNSTLVHLTATGFLKVKIIFYSKFPSIISLSISQIIKSINHCIHMTGKMIHCIVLHLSIETLAQLTQLTIKQYFNQSCSRKHNEHQLNKLY